jgi:molybdopterin converting factor small subunit
MIDDMIPRAESDARVAAAYKVVAKAMGEYHWNRYRTKEDGGELSYPAVFTSHTGQKAEEVCLSLTPEDADAALDAMLAEAEKRGMLRAAEIAWARVEGNSGRDREAAEISTAIRAEAEN